jgi:FdhD protein
MSAPLSPFRTVARASWRGHAAVSGERTIPGETAIALSYNRFAYAVMMATPADLADFALGFSLSERIVTSPDEIEELDIVEAENGIELRLWIAEHRILAFTDRRRFLAGPTGCGLCGIESLAEATRPPPRVVAEPVFTPEALAGAVAALPLQQQLNRHTRAVHAAAYWEPGAGFVALREDVGRHNALDKLAGALAREQATCANGAVLLTSRVSVEMIQKAAVMGAPVVVAISAPTLLALRTSEEAGITLIAVARDDGFEIFTHPHRIDLDWNQHAA